jgi:hypothetical protein
MNTEWRNLTHPCCLLARNSAHVPFRSSMRMASSTAVRIALPLPRILSYHKNQPPQNCFLPLADLKIENIRVRVNPTDAHASTSIPAPSWWL